MAFEHGELIERIAGDDGKIVLEFFAVFSRFECALKRSGFVKGDRHNNAMADWDRFAADVLDARLANEISPALAEANKYLVENPPRKQVIVKANQSMAWQDNPKRAKESEGQYLLRLVRDVRNNLFHGGKYPTGPVDGQALRNADLLRASLTVIAECRAVGGRVKHFFEEAS